MRIAVCLSGQPRTWRIAKENILNFFNIEGVEVDFFIHTWDKNNFRTRRQEHREAEVVQVSDTEFDELTDTFNPKMLEIEKTKKSMIDDHWNNLFYSFMKSIWFKRKYELEHNFLYDIVIKSRLDLNYSMERNFKFVPHEIETLTAYSSHSHFEKFAFELNQPCMDDAFFYSDSPTMDIIANITRWNIDIVKRGIHSRNNGVFISDAEFYYGPGTLLYKFLTLNGIHITNYTYVEYYVVRKHIEEMGLDCIKDWREIQKEATDWYKPLENKKLEEPIVVEVMSEILDEPIKKQKKLI